jgi:hypothetical protein
MGVDDDRPPNPSLQPSTHPSFRFGNKSQHHKNAAATAARSCSRDDDDSDSSLAHSSEMGQSYGTCGRGTARQDSASQQQDSSKEWMLQGIVTVPILSEVVGTTSMTQYRMRHSKSVQKSLSRWGLKASFSIKKPAEIECILIISDIAQVSCDVNQNEKMLRVPVRGCVATVRRTPLDKTLLYLFCERTKLKTAVRSEYSCTESSCTKNWRDWLTFFASK